VNRKINHTRVQGFTLVEILVAMAVFSITLTTIFSAFRTFSTSVDRTRGQIQTTGAGLPGLQAMRSDLDQLFVVPYPRYQRPQDQEDADAYRLKGTQTRIDGRLFSRLSFACVNPAPIGSAPGVARITYYVHQHQGRLDLHRADRTWPFDRPVSPCSDPVLIRGIKGFSLAYTAGDQTQSPVWNSDRSSFDYAFPRRIDISVTLGEETGNKSLGTTAVVPVYREAVK
jgi:prepilin-type N-terminal cleavage/methylation domain-containing protein